MEEAKILATVDSKGAPFVKMEGRHITKRELLRLIKLIKMKYTASIREYRMKGNGNVGKY